MDFVDPTLVLEDRGVFHVFGLFLKRLWVCTGVLAVSGSHMHE
jgi:hypothetical protein